MNLHVWITSLFCVLLTTPEEGKVRAQLIPKIPKCGPNPPSLTAAQLSPPFSTCSAETKKALLQRHPDQNKDTGQVLKTYGYPIHAGFMFAPIAYIGHLNNPIRVAFPLINTDIKYQVVNLVTQGRLQNARQYRTTFKLSEGDLCDLTAMKCGVCDNLQFMLVGYDAPQMNNTELPNMNAKFPNIASIKTMAHFAQLGTNCKFTKYDYGAVGNVKMYKSKTAPEYNLKKIKAPTYFYLGEQDNLGPPNDVNITASKFSTGVLKAVHKVQHKYFNHADFIIAKDADKLLYDLVLKEMKKFK